MKVSGTALGAHEKNKLHVAVQLTSLDIIVHLWCGKDLQSLNWHSDQSD